LKIAIAYDKSNLDNERWKMVQSVSEALSKKYDAEPVAFEDNFCEKVKNTMPFSTSQRHTNRCTYPQYLKY